MKNLVHFLPKIFALDAIAAIAGLLMKTGTHLMPHAAALLKRLLLSPSLLSLMLSSLPMLCPSLLTQWLNTIGLHSAPLGLTTTVMIAIAALASPLALNGTQTKPAAAASLSLSLSDSIVFAPIVVNPIFIEQIDSVVYEFCDACGYYN